MSKKKEFNSMVWSGHDKAELATRANKAEIIIMETYMRTIQELFEQYGIDAFSVSQLNGALVMVEKYQQLCDELSK